MSGRPTDWTVLLYPFGDPVPGSPDIVSAFARKYDTVAKDLKRTADELHRIASAPPSYTAEAQDAESHQSGYYATFIGNVSKVASELKKSEARYEAASKALHAYADVQRRAKDISLVAWEDGTRASKMIETAQAAYSEADTRLNSVMAGDVSQALYLHQRNEAQSELKAWETALLSAIQDLGRATTMRDNSAKDAADAMKARDSDGGLRDSGWTKWWTSNGPAIDADLTDDEVAVYAAGLIVAIVQPEAIPAILAVAAMGATVSGVNAVSTVLQATAGTKTMSDAMWAIGSGFLTTFTPDGDLKDQLDALVVAVDVNNQNAPTAPSPGAPVVPSSVAHVDEIRRSLDSATAAATQRTGQVFVKFDSFQGSKFLNSDSSHAR